MPRVKQGLLKGYHLPDYDGGSTVNLLSSIVRSRGGHSPHKSLKGLNSADLAKAKNVLYLVMDGIGVAQLERFLADGGGEHFFGKYSFKPISTVFPATTAAAVTTFGTGTSPAEHGILSWYLNLPDLGVVSTILFTTTRTGMPIVHADYDLRSYLAIPSHIATVKCRKELLSYGDIVESRYSMLDQSWESRHSYSTLLGMERQVMAFARRRGRSLCYAYWPQYDSLCHEYGCDDTRTVAHLAEIDRLLGRLIRKLAGTNTHLFVLADHGLVDAPPSRRVELSDIPGFYDCMATLPSGDARQVSCCVRASRHQQFLRLVKKHLSKACTCIAGEKLVDSGAFGPGREHPALRNRVGDYVLLARENYAFSSTIPGNESKFNVGNHGGMSAEEVLVPLFSVRC